MAEYRSFFDDTDDAWDSEDLKIEPDKETEPQSNPTDYAERLRAESRTTQQDDEVDKAPSGAERNADTKNNNIKKPISKQTSPRASKKDYDDSNDRQTKPVKKQSKPPAKKASGKKTGGVLPRVPNLPNVPKGISLSSFKNNFALLLSFAPLVIIGNSIRSHVVSNNGSLQNTQDYLLSWAPSWNLLYLVTGLSIASLIFYRIALGKKSYTWKSLLVKIFTWAGLVLGPGLGVLLPLVMKVYNKF